MSDIIDRVYIVDDDPVAAASVAALVAEMGIEAITYSSAEEFLAAYNGHRPGCLVTDVRMLRMSGLELQETLRERGCLISVVVLTGYADTNVTIRAMRAGAFTLLEKPCREGELWDAIRGALRDDAERWKSEERVRQVRERLATLTVAERQVLDRMVAGEMNKQIAHELDVSVRTVEVRRQNLFSKDGSRFASRTRSDGRRSRQSRELKVHAATHGYCSYVIKLLTATSRPSAECGYPHGECG